jgi:MHS family proline/betaine transporter-like MFS transporter
LIIEGQRSLTKEQKQAVGLLSIGTMLEYFDLMLYVHMAVLLNELFFPKTDPFTASLLSAFAFCSTFVFRPFGALVFGYIGDNIGRKHTVIITTFMMAISCIIIANLPTYAQIGITASWLLTLCRIIQGMSSMGEIIGAEIFLTESTKPPIQYPAVALIVTLSTVGTFAALAVASLSTSYNFNWRIAFWIGAVIAVIGAVARTTLRETPDFTDAKRYLKRIFENTKTKIIINEEKINRNLLLKEKLNKKTAVYYFLIECMWPVTFYFVYLHCSNVLKNSFGYTAEDVIHHNLIVSIVNLLSYIIITYLSYKIYPLIILRFRLKIFWIFVLTTPYLLQNVHNPFQVLLIQSFFIIFRPDAFPAVPIYIKHFPIFKRFTYTSWLFALSRATMHIITSFGMVFLVKYFGNIGILIIIIPVSLGFLFGLNHFEKLEKESREDSMKDLGIHALK